MKVRRDVIYLLAVLKCNKICFIKIKIIKNCKYDGKV